MLPLEASKAIAVGSVYGYPTTRIVVITWLTLFITETVLEPELTTYMLSLRGLLSKAIPNGVEPTGIVKITLYCVGEPLLTSITETVFEPELLT